MLCWLSISPIVTAQLIAVADQRPSRVILKFSPLSLLDPDGTVQGAVEVWLKQRQSIQAEFGYGSDRMWPWTFNDRLGRKEVWRARLEGRYYTSLFGKHPHSGTYVAIEGLYKQVNVAYLDTIIANRNSTFDPVFVHAPVTRYVFGLHSKVGTQRLLSYNPSSIWSHVIIDVYAGPGIRHINVVGRSAETALLFQNKRVYERFQYSEYRPGDAFWRLSISAGLKIGVSL